jgi:hypothetical protein
MGTLKVAGFLRKIHHIVSSQLKPGTSMQITQTQNPKGF